MRLKPGDVVTVREGRAQKTKQVRERAEGDLMGVRCVVVDDPAERCAGTNERATQRVHVAPLEQSKTGEQIGMLDIATDRLRRPTGFSLGGAAERIGRIFGGVATNRRSRANYEVAFGTDAERAEMKRTGKTLAELRGANEEA